MAKVCTKNKLCKFNLIYILLIFFPKVSKVLAFLVAVLMMCSCAMALPEARRRVGGGGGGGGRRPGRRG